MAECTIVRLECLFVSKYAVGPMVKDNESHGVRRFANKLK